jgi:hypothetical protein
MGRLMATREQRRLELERIVRGPNGYIELGKLCTKYGIEVKRGAFQGQDCLEAILEREFPDQESASTS